MTRSTRAATPRVFPFRPIQYAAAVGAQATSDLSRFVAPPYDVLDVQGKRGLLEKSDRNIVAVDLPHIPAKDLGPPEVYRGSAVLLEQWMADGTLKRRERPAMFCYRESFDYGGKTHRRTGMACALDIKPFGPSKDGSGGILPHEQTFSGPKEDRMALMKATTTQLSPIFGLHPDEQGRSARLLARICDARQPDVIAATGDGTRHEVWTIDDEETIAAYQDAMAGEDVFIADGHHRYTTSLNYLQGLEAAAKARGEKLPGDHPARQCMFVMVSMSDPGLVIGPTHRVLGGMSGYSFHAFAQHARGTLLLTQMAERGEEALKVIEQAMAKAARKCGKNVLGLYDFASGCAYLATPVDPDPLAFKRAFASKPQAWRTLDVAICQHLIVEELCQPLAGRKDPIKWAFPHSIPEVIDIGAGIERGSGGGKGFVPQLAVIVLPTPLEAVRAVSRANELMPQKSTFFYPKLATGLFLNPVG